MSEVAKRYDENYFAWQNSGADFGARLNAGKFREFVSPKTRVVVDFGCGGGQLLAELAPEKKIGIEINPSAAAHAAALGVEVHKSLSELAGESADLIVSDHALEHVTDPYATVAEMFRVLKAGCRLVVVVPCDAVRYPFVPGDRDFHLFSWSAGNLGNLAVASGFEVDAAAEYVHKWPPRASSLYRVLGQRGFDAAAWVWAMIDRRRSQVRLVARKPAERSTD